METNRIRQFCVVAETENIRKASELLGITHGGLSKSLQVLEREYGQKLLLPQGRGITLTDAGKAFYERSLIFLDDFEKLINPKGLLDNSISIGTFEVFSTYFFSQKIVKEMPEQDFTLREYTPGKLERALLSEEIDFGITYEAIPTQGLEILKITTCEMKIFASKNFHAEKKFEDNPFATPVIPINTTISGVKGLDGWPDDKITRYMKYKVDMLETALQLTGLGKSLIYIPTFIADFYNKTRRIEFLISEFPHPKPLPKLKRDIYLVKRKSTEENADIKKICKILRRL